MSRLGRVILLGADSSLAEAVLRRMEEIDLDIEPPIALAPEGAEISGDFRGEALVIEPIERFSWQVGDCVLVTGRAPWVARACERARAEGGWVLALDEAGQPGAYEQAAKRFLAALERLGRLEWLSLTAFLPVSCAGQAGVEELAEQTRALFALEPVDPEIFPLRIAFNLIPDTRALSEDGEAAFERLLTQALQAAYPGCAAIVSALWCPVFYGGALNVHARLDRAFDLAALRERVSAAPGLTLFDVALPGGIPTPASDAQDSESVFVGRLRQAGERTCNAWLVFDVDRLEAATLVDALEIMIEKKVV